MQRLLEAEQIPHKVKPVTDYRNLGDIYVEHIASSTEARQPPPLAPFAWYEGEAGEAGSQPVRALPPNSASLCAQLRSIVLLNCGGIIDLMDHLQTRLNEEDEESGAPVVS